jgi:hypothetical protein
MKYVVALLFGMVVGAVIFAIGLVYNPFANARSLSPLVVTDAQTMTLSYSSVAAESIVFTNDGESRVRPYPEKVSQLWEESIRQSTVLVTQLRGARNQAMGVGIKFSSLSENTRLLKGEAIIDSAWYLILPEHGSLFFAQHENHWSYFRDVVVAAYRNTANIWKGSWNNTMTSGPGSLGTARVSGASGDFTGQEMLGVEMLSVVAWSADSGPIATEGTLMIELPANDEQLDVQSLD